MGDARARFLSTGAGAAQTLAVSVIVPTIGRNELLGRCLRSVAATAPGPQEVLVVDQSGADGVRRLVQGIDRALVVRSQGRGIALAMNAGLAEARNELVLVTHDDCTVDPDWISTAWELAVAEPRALFTGRVLPAGDRKRVPSVRTDPRAKAWRGTHTIGVLYPNNMAFSRSMAFRLGGFDERLTKAAEDNDFCYRWLRAGHSIRYEPELVVHHHDWRSAREMRRLRLGYGRAQGEFYAKLLRQRDRNVLGWFRSDVADLGRMLAGRLLRRRGGPRDTGLGYLAGLPIGIASGWRRFGPDSDAGGRQ